MHHIEVDGHLCREVEWECIVLQAYEQLMRDRSCRYLLTRGEWNSLNNDRASLDNYFDIVNLVTLNVAVKLVVPSIDAADLACPAQIYHLRALAMAEEYST